MGDLIFVVGNLLGLGFLLWLAAAHPPKSLDEISRIMDSYNIPRYDPDPINKSRYGLMCNEIRLIIKLAREKLNE